MKPERIDTYCDGIESILSQPMNFAVSVVQGYATVVLTQQGQSELRDYLTDLSKEASKEKETA